MKRFRQDECAVDFDVFGYTVHVIFTTDLQKARDSFDKRIGRSFDCKGAAAFHNAIDNESYLFFRWNANEEYIAHESWHAVRKMFEYVSATLENEIVAYHLGHLVGCIHSFKRSLKKGGKKPWKRKRS